MILCSSFLLLPDYNFATKKLPVHVDAEYRYCFDANIAGKGLSPTKLQQSDGDASIYFLQHVNQENTIAYQVGYYYERLHLDNNPFYTGSNYQNGVASIAWITNSVKDWTWILSFANSVDATTWNWGQTGVYYGYMWGRYAFHKSVGVHIGWYGYVGVKNDYVLPILGFDYRIAKRLQLNVIFPVDLSLTYYATDHFSLAAKYTYFGRPYRMPRRIHGGIGTYKNGIIENFANAAELDLTYKTSKYFTLTATSGWNFGGWVLIRDSDNKHGKYLDYDGSVFLRAALNATF